MKEIFLLLLILTLISCGKDKNNKEEFGVFDITEDVSDLNTIANEAEKIERESKKLKESTPITTEELKTFIPKKLIGYSRKEFSIGNEFMPDMTIADAKYVSQDNIVLSFSIIDGAGETGSVMVTLARLGFIKGFEEQNNHGYRKSITINGYKAIEEIKINNDIESSILELLISNRFIITLEGQKISLKQLKNAINELNLKILEQKTK
ncbi:hypothetical protein [Aquimarina longa]|uniref:hypothetical protein n=1 Tax=Aquimarina longa TaxID=1080221 RepID=UPI000785830C|nr:hypothetical protein [Aquimarina longa]